jgi:hypothetical protein
MFLQTWFNPLTIKFIAQFINVYITFQATIFKIPYVLSAGTICGNPCHRLVCYGESIPVHQ